MITKNCIIWLLIIFIGGIVLSSCGAHGVLSSTTGGKYVNPDKNEVKSDTLKK